MLFAQKSVVIWRYDWLTLDTFYCSDLAMESCGREAVVTGDVFVIAQHHCRSRLRSNCRSVTCLGGWYRLHVNVPAVYLHQSHLTPPTVAFPVVLSQQRELGKPCIEPNIYSLVYTLFGLGRRTKDTINTKLALYFGTNKWNGIETG